MDVLFLATMMNLRLKKIVLNVLQKLLLVLNVHQINYVQNALIVLFFNNKNFI